MQTHTIYITIYRIESGNQGQIIALYQLTITFYRNDLLWQFDMVQSNKCDKTDIVAQAMELSSIPTDMNNNKDILSQAIEMSDIASDIMMNFWFDY